MLLEAEALMITRILSYDCIWRAGELDRVGNRERVLLRQIR
jgi:hypothetical protein